MSLPKLMRDQLVRAGEISARGDGLYWCAVLGTALFFLIQDGFYTLDGWVHLSTSAWLIDVLRGDPDMCSFVRLNPFPTPNGLFYLALGALRSILPPLLAERVVWAVILLVLGIGCHRLVRAWCGKANVFLVLCVPVFLSNLFILGFYNFLLALGLAFWSAAWWVRGDLVTMARVIGLLLLSFLLYFMHGSVLVLFAVLIGSMQTWKVVVEMDRDVPVLVRLRALLWPVVAMMPALVLLWSFNSAQPNDWADTPGIARFRDALELKWLLFYDSVREAPQLILFGSALVAGTMLSLNAGARSMRHKGDGSRARPFLLLLLAGLFMVGYFTVPDSSGYASYITLRLFIVGLLLLCLFVASVPLPAGTLLLLALPVWLSLVWKLAYIQHGNAERVALRKPVLDAAASLRPGAVVLAVQRDANWLNGHRASLLASVQRIRLLDNSTCTKGYFPLLWQTGLPTAFVHQIDYTDECQKYMRPYMLSGAQPAVDHIVLMGPDLEPADCSVHALQGLADSLGYRTSFQAGDVRVLSLR
jgi:hypothetical protein